MRSRVLILLVCLGVSTASLTAAESGPRNQTVQKFQRKISTKAGAQYLVFLPEGYQSRGEKRWPMILFLHGAGERGTNSNLVAVHGPPKIVGAKPSFPFIVVSPQCPAGQTWSDEVVLALLSEVTKRYKVDQSRIYLTGLSMGGYGTWSIGLKHPDLFAAIAPICGGGSTLPVLLPEPRIEARLKKLPIWAFHGGKDPVVALDESERLVKLLKRLGNPVKLTVYPEAGHDSWSLTYANQALYDWFLEQVNPLVSSDGKRQAATAN